MSEVHAVLFDLDGVLRQFDRARGEAAAAAHGASLRELARVAFDADLLRTLVTGGLRRAEWVAEVGRRTGQPEAARAWLETTGELDPASVAVVEALKARGVRLGVLTNGTDTIEQELTELGVVHLFDAIVSTWHVGVCKPEARAYHAAAEALALPCERILFTDDRAENIEGARAVGMAGHRFESAAVLRRELVALGLL